VDPFEGYQYTNRFGTVCTTYGASTTGVFRFQALIQQIHHVLANSPEDDLTWQFFYLSDRHFQSAVTECLTLNNIDPDTVTLAMTNSLLFSPGHLIKINTPPETATPRKDSEPSTLGEVIGAIATQTESLEEAIRLAETAPAQQLQVILGGKNKIQRLQTDEGKKAEEAKKNKAKARSQLEAMRRTAT
jgi:hypothetical protein